MDGLCYTASECEIIQGKPGGTCAAGYISCDHSDITQIAKDCNFL
jgi:hypothetical protein